MRMSLQPKYQLGAVFATPGAIELLEAAGTSPADILLRHLSCDWGDLCESDRKTNDRALVEGERLFSAYQTSEGRVWVITEADRSVTTLLLPEEY